MSTPKYTAKESSSGHQKIGMYPLTSRTTMPGFSMKFCDVVDLPAPFGPAMTTKNGLDDASKVGY
jgi:hypothetical protein